MPDLLDPKNDHVFKRLFAEAPELLVALINDLRPDLPDITAVEVLNSTIDADELQGKYIILDVLARYAEGHQYNVEINKLLISREIGLLSAALNWARQEWGWEVPNPAAAKREGEGSGRVRWLSREEAARLLKAAREARQAPWLADFIRLGLHTGMRSGEMLGLEWSRVDLAQGLVYFRQEDQKSGVPGSVPLNREARAALLSRRRWAAERCPDTRWVFARTDGSRVASIKKGFAAACRRAGIEDLRPHDLRHTCAAWLVQGGVPLTEVRDLLRHSSVRVTERYAHLAPHRVRSAVERLEGGESRSSHAREDVGEREGA